MEAQTKLKRTNSSLLRSSQTFRSSVHTIQEEEDDDEEEVKPLKPLKSWSSGLRPGNGVYQYFPFLAIFSLTLSCFFFFFNEKEQIPILLFWGAILIALAVFVAKRKSFGIQGSSFSKFWDEGSRRLGLRKSGCESVEWFIGNGGGSVSSLSSGRLSSRRDVKQGVEFYTSGDFYEGEFHRGRCNGSGVYNFFGNGKYEGDWIDGKYDGYGIESWTRGSRYRGQYRQGLRHGFGIYRFYTGETYAGEWCKGESHGVGVQTCSDGSCYVGEFKCGVKHGLGCYHFRNGDSYSGEYFGDKIHGFGVYHFANGHCYEGSWHEGRKQGFGHYTFRNGETNSGEWDCGVLKNPHPQPHTSDAVLHAVQASRRAAEKALHVPLVDPQVNRAVLSANRAATAARVAAIKAVQNRIDGNFSVADV